MSQWVFRFSVFGFQFSVFRFPFSVYLCAVDLPGFNVGTNSVNPLKRDINTDVCAMPGFLALQWLLARHARVAPLYFQLMAMLLGQPIKELPADLKVSQSESSLIVTLPTFLSGLKTLFFPPCACRILRELQILGKNYKYWASGHFPELPADLQDSQSKSSLLTCRLANQRTPC